MTILPHSIVPLQDTLSIRDAKATWELMLHRLIEAANADGLRKLPPSRAK